MAGRDVVAIGASAGGVPAIEHELEVHQEELTLQQTQLLESQPARSRMTSSCASIDPVPLDVHGLVSEALDVFTQQLRNAHLRLTVDIGAAQHHVLADPVRLNQVLWNVLHNAIRNTPPGGEVRVRSANRRPDAFVLIVSDTGRGIAPDLLPRIFNVFEQDDTARRRGVGLGLGLSISKSIIEAHCGRITAASEGIDRGATFTIELPVAEPPTDGAAAAKDMLVPQRSQRVLLVEDNEDSAAALAELLRAHGYEVLVAGSMRDALQAADRADVLISDIGLPDGSGLDLMRAIVARRPMRAIALSGYGTAKDLRQSAEAGFERHIVKPVEPRRLLEALQSLVRP
jgi:CheY-like chemotaxis protein